MHNRHVPVCSNGGGQGDVRRELSNHQGVYVQYMPNELRDLRNELWDLRNELRNLQYQLRNVSCEYLRDQMRPRDLRRVHARFHAVQSTRLRYSLVRSVLMH
jgi:hypothetical protein